jgi:hypothetical protein
VPFRAGKHSGRADPFDRVRIVRLKSEQRKRGGAHMKRQVILAAVAALFFGAMRGSSPGGDVDINVNLGGYPPPPAVVFEHEPAFVVVPGTQVYYVPGYRYDVYRYGRYYYMNNAGYWYRAKTVRGPFAAVVYERVPGPIVALPAKYRGHPLHPHGGPPGHGKKPGGPGHGKGKGKH